jgi:hypothetical protein
VRVTVPLQAEAEFVVRLVAGAGFAVGKARFAVGQIGAVAAFAVAAGATVTVRLQAATVFAAELSVGVGSVVE